MMQICDGLAYLHSKKIVHKDLKLANIMLTKDLEVKICDFGLSDFLERDKKHIRCGTKIYMAPECFKMPCKYTDKTDCYVLGIMLFEIWLGKMYHKMSYFSSCGCDDIVYRSINGRKPPFLAKNNPPRLVQNFITECWNYYPDKRPSAAQCKQKLRKILMVLDTAAPASKPYWIMDVKKL